MVFTLIAVMILTAPLLPTVIAMGTQAGARFYTVFNPVDEVHEVKTNWIPSKAMVSKAWAHVASIVV